VSNRNRILVVFLCFFALLQPLSLSNASPSGCPNEWNIPKNLFDASADQKKELLTPDFDTVIKPNRDAEYSFDGISWIKVKNSYLNLQALDSIIWEDPLFQRDSEVKVLVNFFGSRWNDITPINLGNLGWLDNKKIYLRTSVEISKQNCGPAATYYYQKELTPPGVEITSFEIEALKIKGGFENYQLYDSFVQRYKTCISKWQSYNNSGESRKPLEPCYFDRTPIRVEIELVPNEPNCLIFLPGNVNIASTVGIKAGSNCSYTILGFTGDAEYVSAGKRGIQATGGQRTSYYNERTGNLVSFGKITISASVKAVKSTCIKGKVIKIVTGSNPKCPKGFKKV
jgi:hypothetical protein